MRQFALLFLIISMGCSESEENSAQNNPQLDMSQDQSSGPDVDVEPDATVDAAGDMSPTPGTLDWFSDWRTATGAEQNALYDGGKWSGQLCDHDVAEVVAADGLDFPTTNVFRSVYPGPGNCLMVQALNQWPLPEVGQYMFVRVYYRNSLPNGSEVGFPHPLHIGWGPTGMGSGYSVWVNFSGPQNDVSNMTLQLAGEHEYPDRFWSWGFTTNQTYRMEFRIQRVTETTAKAAVRVYDTAGQLVADDDDFDNGENGPNLRTFAQSDITIPMDDQGYRLLEIGNNDPVGIVGGSDWYVYWGAAAVRISANANDWPGAYPTQSEL